MEKKQVLEILKELKPHRELAEWMIALIEAWFMDKDTYQNTLFMISTAIKQLPEWKEKQELQKKLTALKDTNKKNNDSDEDIEEDMNAFE